MNSIEIRKAILNDIPQIVKLHIDSWNETYKGIISQDYLDNMKKNERNAI